MDTVRVLTPDNIELEYTLASVGIRLLASVVDMLVQLAAYALLLLGAWLIYGADLFTVELDSWLLAMGLAAIFLIQYGYSILFDLLMRGQTPGKRLFSLRVIRANGQAITPVHAVVREFMKMTIDPLGPGVVFMLFNRQRKRLGDLAAATLVVEEERASLSMPVLPEDAASLGGKQRYPMTREEYGVLESWLARRHNLSNRDSLEARIAGYYRKKYGFEERTDARHFLEELYALAAVQPSSPGAVQSSVRTAGQTADQTSGNNSGQSGSHTMRQETIGHKAEGGAHAD